MNDTNALPNDLITYPDQLPASAYLILANAFRGNFPDKAKAIHVCYHVTGFGLGKFAPDGPVIAAAEPHSHEDLASICESMANGVKRGTIPWDLIIDLAFEILARLRKQS